MEPHIFNQNKYFLSANLNRTSRTQFECVLTVCLYKKFHVSRCGKY